MIIFLIFPLFYTVETTVKITQKTDYEDFKIESLNALRTSTWNKGEVPADAYAIKQQDEFYEMSSEPSHYRTETHHETRSRKTGRKIPRESTVTNTIQVDAEGICDWCGSTIKKSELESGSKCPHCGGPNEIVAWTPITERDKKTTTWYDDEIIQYDTIIETRIPVFDSIFKPKFYYTVDRWQFECWQQDTSHLKNNQRVVEQKHRFKIITLDYEGDTHTNQVDKKTYNKWNVGDYVPTTKRWYGHWVDTPTKIFQNNPVPASEDWD